MNDRPRPNDAHSDLNVHLEKYLPPRPQLVSEPQPLAPHASSLGL